MSSSNDSYGLLAEVLKNRNDHVLEIEILPSGFGPILHDGRNLGITKKALTQAFLVARSLFFGLHSPSAHLENGLGNEAELFIEDEKTELESREISSEIILLFDSEHLSACSWRKRRLQRLGERKQQSAQDYVSALKTELTFTTSLLRSPLPRHSKSPILWYHRYWVMANVLRAGVFPLNSELRTLGSSQTPRSLGVDEEILGSEVSVVLRAGEHHRMNYYAFNYLRRFLGLLARTMDSETKTSGTCYDRETITQSVDSEAGNFNKCGHIMDRLAKSIVETVRDWCHLNPSDNSGWMFLFYLLLLVQDPALRREVTEGVVTLGFKIAWKKEALWTFVDLSTTKFGIILDHPKTVDGRRLEDIRTNEKTSPSGWKAWADSAAQMKVVHD